MSQEKEELHKDNKKIVNWLAHHNPNRVDFDDHVLYIFNYAVCIGCFAFGLSAIVALVLCNVSYHFIVNVISLPIVIMIFLACWLPSIFQYWIQIIRKKTLHNRLIKFLCRFLYPLGSIILIFKSPLWGFLISIPAGYLIIIIRKVKIKALMPQIKFK